MVRLTVDHVGHPVKTPKLAPIKQIHHDQFSAVPPSVFHHHSSLVLMAFFNITSFHKWFRLLRLRPEYRYFSGFFERLPRSHASFYDFTARLLDGPYQKPCSHCPAPLSDTMTGGDKGRWLRHLSDEKADRKAPPPETDENVLKGYVDRALAALPAPSSHGWVERFNQLLLKCAILPSQQRGLLDLSKLTVSVDGSSVRSHASWRGSRACSCPSDPERRRCGCPRFYADPEATWGWDSHRKVYSFGHRLHALTTNAGQTDLLLYASVDGAHKNDEQMDVVDVVDFIRLLRPLLPLAHIKHLICDMGYDHSDFYRFLDKLDILPVIPLKPSAATLGADENGTKFNQNRRWGEQKKAAKERRRRSYGKKQGFWGVVRVNRREKVGILAKASLL
ncbi:transposase [Myxococcota bacterium]|nr:transposase [Myxococcota bacterium]